MPARPSRRRVRRTPMTSNRLPITQPHAFTPLNVIEQPLQRTDSPRPADDTGMQANAHHTRAAFAAPPVQPIERLRAIAEELLAAAEIGPALHAAVVAIKRVRDNELMGLADLRPIRQI